MSETSAATARQLDAADPLAGVRDEFDLPDGIYFVGNSLGPLPKATREYIGFELERWGSLGVEGHFIGDHAWAGYHAEVADQLARMVGARPDEVVAMNALTVNLHLLLVSFYRPTPTRHKVLIEAHAFPSDHFAVESQIRQRGFDPRESLVVVEPRAGEECLRAEDIRAAIERLGDELALVLLPGVQYFTGQVLPMADIVAAGHAAGALVGLDLAHAIANVPLQLHDWGVDFAVWCSYKYLNSGPGGVAGAFVHERHVADQSLPKFVGWWGTNPTTRFEMTNRFDAIATVESWQPSNASILPLAALRASLDLIDRAGGIDAMRAKSERQIDFLDRRLADSLGERVSCLTPDPLPERGCQFALRMSGGIGRQVFDALTEARVFCDWREPDVIRVAPTPLYNTFAEIDRFVDILDEILTATQTGPAGGGAP